MADDLVKAVEAMEADPVLGRLPNTNSRATDWEDVDDPDDGTVAFSDVPYGVAGAFMLLDSFASDWVLIRLQIPPGAPAGETNAARLTDGVRFTIADEVRVIVVGASFGGK